MNVVEVGDVVEGESTAIEEQACSHDGKSGVFCALSLDCAGQREAAVNFHDVLAVYGQFSFLC